MSTCSEQHVICVDMGTTNTRVWLVVGDEIVVRAQKNIGVKVATKEGSTHQILKQMVSEVLAHRGEAHQPECIAAAGMITSGLGLKEISHIPAPAGLSEIVCASECHHFGDISNLPFVLVPGVSMATTKSIRDVMRGEETLCLGLISSGLLNLPGMVLNLGSHWKAIEVDSHARICSSVTSLSGELIDAVRTQTVLAGSLPQAFPDELNWEWVEAGATECRVAGLPRTLFRVRLLELNKAGNAEERLAFLVGAFIASDLDALVARGMFSYKQVVISGHRAIAESWRRALQQRSVPVSVLSTQQRERAFLKGLQQVVNAVGSVLF
jgi:2-dehydro-3-deoxygalactonokinase